jgi:hypothetical protein
MNAWYPQSKKQLNALLEKFLSQKQISKEKNKEKIHGLIVPHAGYQFSGEVAGKAYALLKGKKIKKAIVIGPSHQIGFYGIAKLSYAKTPLGETNISKEDITILPRLNYEHSVDNQVPFLQKLNPEIEILPIVVGDISETDAKKVAEDLTKISKKAILIFSTDLSHFFPYKDAERIDKESIKQIIALNNKNIDACGINPLKIFFHLAKLKGFTPKLVEYKNSGDITGDKDSVVGYASFYF